MAFDGHLVPGKAFSEAHFGYNAVASHVRSAESLRSVAADLIMVTEKSYLSANAAYRGKRDKHLTCFGVTR
jgi:hypothetical protein